MTYMRYALHRVVASLFVSFLGLGILTAIVDFTHGWWPLISMPLCCAALFLMACIFDAARSLGS